MQKSLLTWQFLLDDDTASQYTMEDLPTNLDVISALKFFFSKQCWGQPVGPITKPQQRKN